MNERKHIILIFGKNKKHSLRENLFTTSGVVSTQTFPNDGGGVQVGMRDKRGEPNEGLRVIYQMGFISNTLP